jgi:hypothetical protein
MPSFYFSPFAIIFVLWFFFIYIMVKRDLRHRWESCVRQLGLEDVVSGGLVVPWVTAGGAGFKIMIWEGRLSRVEIELTALGQIDNGIEMRARGLVSELALMRKGDEIAIGDGWFDSTVIVRGRQSLLMALLDAETRQRAASFVKGGGRIKDGRLRCSIGQTNNDKLLRQAVIGVTGLARSLHTPNNQASALANILINDPCLSARLRSLRLLVIHHPDREETTEALRAVSHDPSPEVRLRAAIAIGAEGKPVLEELAWDPDVADAIRVEALHTLGPSLEVERAATILEAAVRWNRRPLVAEAAVEVLGLSGDRAVPWLLPVLECRIAAVVCAAARVLEAHGTVVAVPYLREAIMTEPFNLSIRGAVTRAIATIQARATDAEPGQLALADTDGETGQLSLTTDDVGHLSLAR